MAVTAWLSEPSGSASWSVSYIETMHATMFSLHGFCTSSTSILCRSERSK